MNFSILGEDKAELHDYVEKAEKSFLGNETAVQYVKRGLKAEKTSRGLVLDVEFSTIFSLDLFKYIATFIMLGGIGLRFLFGVPLYPAIFLALFVLTPFLIQSKYVIFQVIKSNAKKVGYTGKLVLISQKEREGLQKI